MFWDQVAGVYDLFVNVYNRRVHVKLRELVGKEISGEDVVLECACGTGMLSEVIAPRCRHLAATDFSEKMLEKTARKCEKYGNVEFRKADLLALDFPDESFDVVVAANVIHLLDEPQRGLSELARVCRKGGKIIIPTYMNREKTGRESAFSRTVGKAGADFKHSFTFTSYQKFFEEAGYDCVNYCLVEGRVPCAVAVIRKEFKEDTV